MAKNQRDSAEEPRPHEPSLELFPNLTALDVDKLHAKQTASARGEGSALRNEQRVCTPQDTRQEDWCLVTRQLLLPTLATFFGYLLWLLLWLLLPLSVYQAFFCQLLVRQASVRVCATCVWGLGEGRKKFN